MSLKCTQCRKSINAVGFDRSPSGEVFCSFECLDAYEGLDAYESELTKAVREAEIWALVN